MIYVRMINVLLQPSWCGYGWTWNNICKWDLFPTGKDSFSKNWLKCELFQNPSSGWRFFGDVIFTNVVVRYSWIHHQSDHYHFCFRQVVVLTWWSCWSLANEFFYFQVILKGQSYNYNHLFRLLKVKLKQLSAGILCCLVIFWLWYQYLSSSDIQLTWVFFRWLLGWANFSFASQAPNST